MTSKHFRESFLFCIFRGKANQCYFVILILVRMAIIKKTNDKTSVSML